MPLRYAERASEAYDFPLTIRHLLDAAMVTARDQKIFYRDQFSMTYAELEVRIAKLASVLSSLGVERGTTVAVMDWDSHRYLEAYFAVPMMGAVLQTVNVRMPLDQIAYTLAHAHAEVLIVHRDFLPMVGSLLTDLDDIKSVVVAQDSSREDLPTYAAGEYEGMLSAAACGFQFEDFDENALATTFYTTGTTGSPKGVCFTHRQLVLHSLAVNAPFGTTDRCPRFGIDDVYMPLTPMFHVHAWGMPYVATMLGVKQIYPGRYEPDVICGLREKHKVTYSHCVPTVLQMVLDAAEASDTDLTGWNMTIGGSALTRRLYELALLRGIQVYAGYGMSETCPAVAIAQDDPRALTDAASKADARIAAGRPLPMVTARVVDAEMRNVPHDDATRGELVIRAPWLTPCYIGDREASEALWKGGWMHTQDVATISPSGIIRIRDRLKDVIKTGGEWLDSILLEDLLTTVSGVREASVIAIRDIRWGERPLAIIVAEPDAQVSLEALNHPLTTEIAAGRISRYAKLERFEVVEALPRTSVGKIDKKALRSKFDLDAQPLRAP